MVLYTVLLCTYLIMCNNKGLSIYNKLHGKPHYMPPPLRTLRPSSSPYTPYACGAQRALLPVAVSVMNIHDVRDRQTDDRQLDVRQYHCLMPRCATELAPIRNFNGFTLSWPLTSSRKRGCQLQVRRRTFSPNFLFYDLRVWPASKKRADNSIP